MHIYVALCIVLRIGSPGSQPVDSPGSQPVGSPGSQQCSNQPVGLPVCLTATPPSWYSMTGITALAGGIRDSASALVCSFPARYIPLQNRIVAGILSI